MKEGNPDPIEEAVKSLITRLKNSIHRGGKVGKRAQEIIEAYKADPEALERQAKKQLGVNRNDLLESANAGSGELISGNEQVPIKTRTPKIGSAEEKVNARLDREKSAQEERDYIDKLTKK